MSAGELSEIVLRSSGGMTQILDRLEQLGLVHRVTDRNDRRKVLAELTDEGLDVAQKASAAYARERRRILRHLSAPQAERVDSAVRLLLDVFTDDAVARVTPCPDRAQRGGELAERRFAVLRGRPRSPGHSSARRW